MSKPLADLEEIERVWDAATGSEWRVEDCGGYSKLYAVAPPNMHDLYLLDLSNGDTNVTANLEAIASAPVHVAKLIAEIRRLDAVNATLGSELAIARNREKPLPEYTLPMPCPACRQTALEFSPMAGTRGYIHCGECSYLPSSYYAGDVVPVEGLTTEQLVQRIGDLELQVEAHENSSENRRVEGVTRNLRRANNYAAYLERQWHAAGGPVPRFADLVEAQNARLPEHEREGLVMPTRPPDAPKAPEPELFKTTSVVGTVTYAGKAQEVMDAGVDVLVEIDLATSTARVRNQGSTASGARDIEQEQHREALLTYVATAVQAERGGIADRVEHLVDEYEMELGGSDAFSALVADLRNPRTTVTFSSGAAGGLVTETTVNGPLAEPFAISDGVTPEVPVGSITITAPPDGEGEGEWVDEVDNSDGPNRPSFERVWVPKVSETAKVETSGKLTDGPLDRVRGVVAKWRARAAEMHERARNPRRPDQAKRFERSAHYWSAAAEELAGAFAFLKTPDVAGDVGADAGPYVSLQSAIRLLNEAIELDAVAVSALFGFRAECTDGLADHPTIQVNGQDQTVGMVGLLNGIFGARADGWGHITAVYENAVDGSYLRVRHVEETER